VSFFGIVQAYNASPGVENHRGGNDRTKERTASGLIDAGDAQSSPVCVLPARNGKSRVGSFAVNSTTRKSRKGSLRKWRTLRKGAVGEHRESFLYSWRKAINGSSRAARLAGTTDANRATPASKTAAHVYVGASVRETP